MEEEQSIKDEISLITSQEFMSVKDIGKLLSLNPKKAYYVTQNSEDFPKGYKFSQKILRWKTEDVLKWLQKKRDE